MNIRIVSGQFGGRKIESTDNDRTHPMGERIRNALFNSLGSDVEDTEILDAFAGTGSIGLEALSRGASRVTFIEKDRIAQTILAKNVTMLGLEERATIIRATVSNWLTSADRPLFDIIFVDPPYDDPQFSTAEKLLGLLKPNGIMVLSHPGRSETPTRPGVVVVDNRSYGSARLTFYRREDI